MLKTATFMLLLSACDLAAQRADTIVKTASRPVHRDVAALRREISIGVSDGDEKYMLGAIADVAVSVVPKERSGMAAGINDTFRQVGVAVGIAVWGAIFVGRGADKVAELTAGTPTASGDHPRQLVEAVSSGNLNQALATVPPPDQAAACNAANLS